MGPWQRLDYAYHSMPILQAEAMGNLVSVVYAWTVAGTARWHRIFGMMPIKMDALRQAIAVSLKRSASCRHRQPRLGRDVR